MLKCPVIDIARYAFKDRVTYDIGDNQTKSITISHDHIPSDTSNKKCYVHVDEDKNYVRFEALELLTPSNTDSQTVFWVQTLLKVISRISPFVGCNSYLRGGIVLSGSSQFLLEEFTNKTNISSTWKSVDITSNESCIVEFHRKNFYIAPYVAYVYRTLWSTSSIFAPSIFDPHCVGTFTKDIMVSQVMTYLSTTTQRQVTKLELFQIISLFPNMTVDKTKKLLKTVIDNLSTDEKILQDKQLAVEKIQDIITNLDVKDDPDLTLNDLLFGLME